MKKLYSLMLTVLFVGLTFLAQAQEKKVIAGWSITAATDVKATDGIDANKGIATISNSQGTDIGYASSYHALVCSGWHAEAGKEKYWLIGPVSFEGFGKNLTFRYENSGSNTGPSYFYYECKIGTEGEWMRAPQGYKVANTNPATKYGPIELPAEDIANQKEVYFRLIVDPDSLAINGNAVANGGTNRLAEVYFEGEPAEDPVTITATPEFNPEARTFTDPFDMKIFCKTPDATIYYTMDGTTPTDSTAEKYDGNLIRIDTTTTVKAFAVAAGMDPSEVAEVTYTYVAPAKPSVQFLSLEDGGTYANPIHLEVAVENFTICDAGEGDGYLKFESPIIDEFAKATGLDSLIGLKNPVFCDQFMFETMSSFPIVVEPGKYTITASLVGKDSAEFTPAIAQTITVTIINPAIYTTAPDTIILPEVMHPVVVGIMGEGLTDSIVVSTSNAWFKLVDTETYKMDTVFTIDPYDITVLGVIYMGPADTMIYATMTLTSGEITNEITLNYGLSWDTLPAPEFSIPEGTYTEAQTLKLTCLNPDAIIYYTLDGSDPDTNEAALIYEKPIEITETTIVKAYAWSPYAYESAIVTAKYVIEPTGVKEISVVDAKVYPNPATSFVKVELGDASAQRVEVISMNGQKVYAAANQGDNFTISMNNFTKGVYFIRIITTDNEMVVKKVVKM